MTARRSWRRRIERFGRIDILINNVGGTIWAKPYAHYQPAEIESEIRRSLYPTLWCCHAVLPYFLEQGHGTIVNVSSVATRGVNRVPYAAAKGGVNALTASLALEYAASGIRVVATAPGGIDAPERRIARGPTVREDRAGKSSGTRRLSIKRSTRRCCIATEPWTKRPHPSSSWPRTRRRTSPEPDCRSPAATSAELQ